jgi:hypothetical protein
VAKRALLISGGVNPKLDYQRYRNDIVAFVDILIRSYGFDREDIRVCMGPGGTLPSHRVGVILATAARRSEVVNALRWLAALGNDDLAFLLVTDHGTDEGISLWRETTSLTPSEITAILNHSSAQKLLVFGQCHSGIFGVSPPNNSVVLCACDANASSYPVPAPAPGVQPAFNEFLYQLAGALGGQYPDGSELVRENPIPPPEEITIQEAFDYARNADRWFSGLRQYTEYPRLYESDLRASDFRLR